MSGIAAFFAWLWQSRLARQVLAVLALIGATLAYLEARDRRSARDALRLERERARRETDRRVTDGRTRAVETMREIAAGRHPEDIRRANDAAWARRGR